MKQSTITYQIIKDENMLVAVKEKLEEAVDVAIKYSNLCSSLFTIREVKIETNDLSVYPLGKIKY